MMESEYPSSVEAIGRAIELQSSWRHCIDRMASKWLDRHVKANPDFCILKDSETDRPILIAAMQKLWADHHWPRQSMNQKHWETLAEMIQGRARVPARFPPAFASWRANSTFALIYAPVTARVNAKMDEENGCDTESNSFSSVFHEKCFVIRNQ